MIWVQKARAAQYLSVRVDLSNTSSPKQLYDDAPAHIQNFGSVFCVHSRRFSPTFHKISLRGALINCPKKDEQKMLGSIMVRIMLLSKHKFKMEKFPGQISRTTLF